MFPDITLYLCSLLDVVKVCELVLDVANNSRLKYARPFWAGYKKAI